MIEEKQQEFKEPIRLKDLGKGDDGENVESLRRRFSEKKGNKIDKQEDDEKEENMRKKGQYEIYDSSDSDEEKRGDLKEPKSKSKWADIYGQGAGVVSNKINKQVGDLTYYREQGVSKVRGGRLRGRGGSIGSRGGSRGSS